MDKTTKLILVSLVFFAIFSLYNYFSGIEYTMILMGSLIIGLLTTNEN